MRKQLIYAGIFGAIIGFSACNEDFKDWADPQSNPQPEQVAGIPANFSAGKDAVIIMDNEAETDSVEIAAIAASTDQAGSVYAVHSVTVNENHTIPFAFKAGNIVKVKLAELDSITQEAYRSRASVERELTVKLDASVTTSAGQGFKLEGNDVTVKLTPETTPAVDPAGYYVVGAFSPTPLAMTQDAANENLYVLDYITSGDIYFKFYPAAAVNGQSVDETQALGAAEENDASGDAFIVWKDAQTIKSTVLGDIKITLDVTNFRFTVKEVSPELYMTGSAYGWGATWNQLVPVGGVKGAFWGIYYFAADDEIKFAPQADWGGDFGYNSSISQESIDLAGLSDSGGNIKIGNAGWYLLYVNSGVAEFRTPVIYLMGELSYNGWDSQLVPEDLFTNPTTADGAFVSPAFVADGNLRICVKPELVGNVPGDWWKAEFIVDGGQIVYRGNGGDPANIPETTGQKVYLYFGDGTGKIE